MLTKEEIQKLNKQVDGWDEGIFTEPNWIPVHIKEPVLYLRWSTGGMSGGGCWDSSDPQPYYNHDEEPSFKILDLYLKKYKPNISYLQYKEVELLIHTNSETEYEYYGNCTEWSVKYIVLSELEKLLSKI